MKELRFVGEIWKVGNSRVVTVPTNYFGEDLLKEGEKYVFTIEKIKG